MSLRRLTSQRYCTYGTGKLLYGMFHVYPAAAGVASVQQAWFVLAILKFRTLQDIYA
jgi:hypothetical protein